MGEPEGKLGVIRTYKVHLQRAPACISEVTGGSGSGSGSDAPATRLLGLLLVLPINE